MKASEKSFVGSSSLYARFMTSIEGVFPHLIYQNRLISVLGYDNWNCLTKKGQLKILPFSCR